MSDGGGELQLEADVIAALDELFVSDDPLDHADFDPLEYINELFPNEQSLSSLDATIARMKKKIRVLDEDLQRSIRSQTHTSTSEHALHEAQEGMAALMQRIRDIQQTAVDSERMVEEITRDIKCLDNAKRNLTVSITTLNHLHMLIGGVDSLDVMVSGNQYYDAANLLAAVMNVLQHFKDHQDVSQVKELVSRVEGIKDTLANQIRVEFHKAFRRQQPPPDTNTKLLGEACAVLDVLDASIKDELVAYFIEGQLQDYEPTFSKDSEEVWLDKVDRRYAWFKRVLANYRDHFVAIFPEKWAIPTHLSLRFCEDTRKQLHSVMKAREDDINAKTLLYAIQKTEHFEQLLTTKFFNPDTYYGTESDDANANSSDADDNDDNADDDDDIDSALNVVRSTTGSAHGDHASKVQQYRLKYLQHKRQRELQAGGGMSESERQQKKRRARPSPFLRAISQIFGNYLHVYVASQGEVLGSMMETFASEFKSSLIFPEETADNHESAKVLESAGDMFLFFRNSMQQCVGLSTGKPLFGLFEIFNTYLKQYATDILSANLPKSSSLASILSKEADLKLSIEEVYLVISILNTANYALEMTEQLEVKLKEKIDDEFKDKIDLMAVQDVFNDTITTCVQLLIRSLETSCVPYLSVITKTKWEQLDEVGDTSLFVSQIGKTLMSVIPSIRVYLGENRKYFTNFCLKFANSFIPKVLAHLKKCKSYGMTGAEQLLLDVQSLYTVFEKMPSMGADIARSPPKAYMKIVTRGLNQAKMLLKTVMAPHDAPEIFVEDFYKLLGQEDQVVSFQKILELKGLKKSDQQPLLAAFKHHATSASLQKASSGTDEKGTVGGKSSQAPHLAVTSSSATSTGGDKAEGKKKKGRANINIRKLEYLIKRFQ